MSSSSSSRVFRAAFARRGASAVVAFFSVFTVAPVPAQQAGLRTQDPVVITATRTPQPLSSVLADMSVVDREQIERSGALDVADLLGRLPGVEFSRNGGPGGTTGVFIRGGETRHTAVYIDGVRVDSQATGGAPWEQIPLEQIDRIEVLRGPAAAIYGSDAVSGVVQLFTKRGQGPAKPSASVSLGSYGTARLQAGISGAANAFDYSLSASHGRSDGFDARTAAAVGHNPDDDGWKRSAMRGRVGFQVDPRHRLEASLLASNLRTGYDDFVPGADDQSRYTLRTGSLAWQGRWNDDASTRLQFGQTLTTYETQPSFYRSETTLRDVTLQHEQRVGTNLFTGTLERRDDELVNPATEFADRLEGRRHQTGIGLGWRGEFGDHGLQAHARHDDDSEFGGKSTGSLAWGWTFLPAWRVTVAAATAFRSPTLYQRFSQYGNPALTPETGRSIEAGLRWSDAGHSASLTAWRNKVDNLINFGGPGPCRDAFGCFENVGRADLRGVTLAGNTRLAGLTLRGSLDWRDPRNDDTDKLVARRARRLATLGAELQQWGWTWGSEVQAVGTRFDDAANTRRLGGYGLVNLFAGTRLAPGLDLLLRIDNLGDKQYEQAFAYATLGRFVSATVRWTTP